MNDKKITIICKICKRNKTGYKTQMGEQKFCSQTCWGISNSHIFRKLKKKYGMLEDALSDSDLIIMTCVVCKDAFKVSKQEYLTHKKDTCSPKCLRKLELEYIDIYTDMLFDIAKEVYGNKCEICKDSSKIKLIPIDGNIRNNPKDHSNWMLLCEVCEYRYYAHIYIQAGAPEREFLLQTLK